MSNSAIEVPRRSLSCWLGSLTSMGTCLCEGTVVGGVGSRRVRRELGFECRAEDAAVVRGLGDEPVGIARVECRQLVGGDGVEPVSVARSDEVLDLGEGPG